MNQRLLAARAALCLLGLGLGGCSRASETSFDCSSDGRKAFVASIMSDFYLWYDQVPPVDYSSVDTPEDLLSDMMYQKLDHWSTMQKEAERTAFFDEGRFQGFGYTLGYDQNGGLRISWVHEGSAAGRAGLDRGALILAVNGHPVQDLSSTELNVELSKTVVVHQIQELDGTVHDVELTQGDVEITSVKDVTVLDSPNGPVGYLMFTTFVKPGEDELRAAFSQFQAAGVQQLVIDLRYNGGGLLTTAGVLGSLIETGAAGQPLIVETYNDRHTDLNRQRLLEDTAEGVNASHVVFLTTGRTASASEQVINGLSPYTQVDVVGLRTLGKPVGADSWEQCGYAIAPITFHSLNANGEGDYFDGIEPKCEVDDDLLHRLGDPEEAQLKAALRVLDGKSCDATDEPPAAPSDLSSGTSTLRLRLPPRLPGNPLAGLPGWY
jgi:carboxyl-terminal processing protease